MGCLFHLRAGCVRCCAPRTGCGGCSIACSSGCAFLLFCTEVYAPFLNMLILWVFLISLPSRGTVVWVLPTRRRFHRGISSMLCACWTYGWNIACQHQRNALDACSKPTITMVGRAPTSCALSQQRLILMNISYILVAQPPACRA